MDEQPGDAGGAAGEGRCFVTGGAGFIGTHLVEELLDAGRKVTVYDARSLDAGRAGWLSGRPGLHAVRGDLRDRDRLRSALKGHRTVFHLAAFTDTRRSADVREGDLQHGTVATWSLLESMQAVGIDDLVFTSSQLVYGETEGGTALGEDFGPLQPISLYGASKMACEGLISAYSHLFGIRAVVCRLCNVVGGRMTGGIVYDFMRKLVESPDRLEVLGDGRQARSYLLVDLCVDALLQAHRKAPTEGFHVYNVGNRDTITAREVADIVAEEMGMRRITEIVCEDRDRGWPGDVPDLRLDIERLRSIGWTPSLGSAGSIRETVQRLQRESARDFDPDAESDLVQLVPSARVADGSAAEGAASASDADDGGAS